MEKPISLATADFNGDFIRLITMSQGMMGYSEPDAPPQYLVPSVSDEDLGSRLRLALAASKRVPVEEFQKIFRSGIVQEIAKEREKLAMENYGYKTRRAMYKKMDTCTISHFEGRIEIQPSHQKSLDGYTGIEDAALDVPVTASDAELGAALREGFKRCTSAIR